MISRRLSPSRLMAMALGAAVALRLLPIFFEIPLGRDVAEYRNIASNLRAGRGFELDIKAYYAVDSPVRHYSGSVRAPLTPVYLLMLGAIVGERVAGALAGPLLYTLLIALVFDLVRRRYSAPTALFVALLLGVHPGLFQVSLAPLSEAVTLLFMALALWARFALRSPALAGAAVALAFLSRSSASILGLGLGALYLFEAVRDRSMRRLALFALPAALGPAALIALNLSSGAPALQTAQSFLFRVLHFTDHVHYFHRGPIYDSTAALVAENGPAVARQIAKNAFYYARALGSNGQGIGYLLPLVPFAALGWWTAPAPRRRFVAFMAALALADLGLYVFSWSTFDSARFLSVFNFAAIIAIGCEGAPVLSRIGERLGGRLWPSLASFVFGLIVLLWGAGGAYYGYSALREWQEGRPYTSNLEPLWYGEAREPIQTRLAAHARAGDLNDESVIASNEPWLAYTLSGFASALIPYDLQPEEWLDFLRSRGADFVLIHKEDWPAENTRNLEALHAELEAAGWKVSASHDPITLWIAPSRSAANEESINRD